MGKKNGFVRYIALLYLGTAGQLGFDGATHIGESLKIGAV